MNNENKTNCILFSDTSIIQTGTIRDFRGFEVDRKVTYAGTIIVYKNLEIAETVYDVLKRTFGESMMAYIFPNFIDLEHYNRNQDSHFAQFPQRYPIVSPLVQSYLLNAAFHPLMAMQPPNTAASSSSITPHQYSTMAMQSPTNAAASSSSSTPHQYATMDMQLPTNSAASSRSRTPHQYATYESVPSFVDNRITTSQLQDYSRRGAPNYLIQNSQTPSRMHSNVGFSSSPAYNFSERPSQRLQHHTQRSTSNYPLRELQNLMAPRRSTPGGTRLHVGSSSSPGYRQPSPWNPVYSSDTFRQSQGPQSYSSNSRQFRNRRGYAKENHRHSPYGR